MFLRAASVLMVLCLAVPLFAVDPGRAEGTLTTDKKETPLAFAYAVHRVHSDATGKNDATKIILTDKPLPEGTKLRDVDYNFPEGIFGIVVCVDRQQQPVHVVVQHPTGVYDGGWVDLDRDVAVRMRENNGMIEGHLRCRGVERPSVTYAFDVDFNAKAE